MPTTGTDSGTDRYAVATTKPSVLADRYVLIDTHTGLAVKRYRSLDIAASDAAFLNWHNAALAASREPHSGAGARTQSGVRHPPRTRRSRTLRSRIFSSSIEQPNGPLQQHD